MPQNLSPNVQAAAKHLEVLTLSIWSAPTDGAVSFFLQELALKANDCDRYLVRRIGQDRAVALKSALASAQLDLARSIEACTSPARAVRLRVEQARIQQMAQVCSSISAVGQSTTDEMYDLDVADVLARCKEKHPELLNLKHRSDVDARGALVDLLERVADSPLSSTCSYRDLSGFIGELSHCVAGESRAPLCCVARSCYYLLLKLCIQEKVDAITRELRQRHDALANSDAAGPADESASFRHHVLRQLSGDNAN